MNVIEIRSHDHYQFLKYIGYGLNKQPACHNIRRFYAQVEYDTSGASTSTSCLLTPWIGKHEWDYNGEKISIEITEEGEPRSIATCLEYFHRIKVSHASLDVLSKFVAEALVFTKPIQKQQIKIYFSRSKGYWEHFNNIYAQPIDKIYMDEAVKKSIIQKIDSFIESKQRYITYGRSYKLNFLLTGVPGAGKTSTVKAIALKYDRPVYVLSFTKDLTDETLVSLMAEVKDNSIILLEDIDAFFVDRESKKDTNVSFSALLNIMDGTMMKGNGTMMFLTANNPERLDPALTRAGRIDHIIKYDFPRQHEVKEAFMDITGATDEKCFDTFYKKIRGLQVNMSSIVDFLFRYTTTYMENIDELLVQTKLRQDIANDKPEKMYT